MNHLAHYALQTNIKKRQSSKGIATVDLMAYIVGTGGNIAVIPQIIRAWQGSAPGLAIMTWLLFIAIGFIWLVYAVIHRQRPLIVAQVLGISCNFAVVLGWMMNNLIR